MKGSERNLTELKRNEWKVIEGKGSEWMLTEI